MILKLKAETEKVDLVQETCVTWKNAKMPTKERMEKGRKRRMKEKERLKVM